MTPRVRMGPCPARTDAVGESLCVYIDMAVRGSAKQCAMYNVIMYY